MGLGPQRAANGVWIPSLRACTTCLCSWPDRNERVENEAMGSLCCSACRSVGFHQNLINYPPTPLVAGTREANEVYGFTLEHISTGETARDHSGRRKSDLISNKWRSCRGHQGRAFSYSPFPRVSPAMIHEHTVYIYIRWQCIRKPAGWLQLEIWTVVASWCLAEHII